MPTKLPLYEKLSVNKKVFFAKYNIIIEKQQIFHEIFIFCC